MAERAREVSQWRKNPKRLWWDDVVKAVVKRKIVLRARDEVTKERYGSL